MATERSALHLFPTTPEPAAAAREILEVPLRFPATRGWWIATAIGALLLGLFVVSCGVLFFFGVGIWGNNIPNQWGFPILNYIWWLGIGHAGTFISALLLLLNQPWRNSLNRVAETMTLFAVACAGVYPILHLGRPWLFYWTAPYPSTMGVWPQFKSPLAWDFVAVLTYLGVSTLFWYTGAIPDFAALRDRARKRRWQIFAGILALGWRGSAVHWQRWTQAYRLIAILAVPLVISVSSGYSFLLDLGQVPGWHSTVFPPYFVAGAVFSGFALVAILAAVLRRALHFMHLITPRHLNFLGITVLVTGLMTDYGYLADIFTAYYSGETAEVRTTVLRFTGDYAWSFWLAIFCNVVVIQLLWSRRIRMSPLALSLVCLAALIGMWVERFMLMFTSQSNDFLVSAFGDYAPTFWDWSLFIGTLGLWLFPFCLVIRFVPAISSFELSETLHQARAGREKQR